MFGDHSPCPAADAVNESLLLLPLFDVTDVSSGEEDPPEPVEQDEETRELRIIDPNAYVSLCS